MWDKGRHFLLQRLFLSLTAVCCMLPLLFLLLGSLRWEGGVSLAQYEEVLLYTRQFFIWFWNAVYSTAMILLIHLPVSVLAGYAFSQFSFPGKRPLFFLYLILMLLPFQATVVPQYLTLNALSLLDTRWAVILPNAVSAFGAFLMAQYMMSIDPEIIQAARLDGVGSLGLLWRVILPLCRPAVVSLAVLQFFSCWSLIDQPLLFLRREELLPLSLELTSQTFGASAMAAGVIYAVPPILAYLYCQRALEQGICLSSYK